jgi:hypothetical protein
VNCMCQFQIHVPFRVLKVVRDMQGVKLAKELMSVAGNALRTNITTLGPKVLPVSEQLKFGLDMISRKVCIP